MRPAACRLENDSDRARTNTVAHELCRALQAEPLAGPWHSDPG